MLGIMIDRESLLIVGVPLLIFVIAIRIILQKKKTQCINIMKESTIFLLGIYTLLLVGVTLFPIDIILRHEPMKGSFIAVNLIPFKSIINDINNLGNHDFSMAFGIKLLIRNVAGNLILLTPLGILAPMLWEKLRSFKNCVLLGVLTSLSIEILQLIESYFKLGMRTVDVDDLILNVLGITIGYFIFKLIFSTKIASYFNCKNIFTKDIKY